MKRPRINRCWKGLYVICIVDAVIQWFRWPFRWWLPRSTVSTIEQVADLLFSSYRKWVLARVIRSCGVTWSVVCLLAAPRVQLFVSTHPQHNALISSLASQRPCTYKIMKCYTVHESHLCNQIHLQSALWGWPTFCSVHPFIRQLWITLRLNAFWSKGAYWLENNTICSKTPHRCVQWNTQNHVTA